MDISIEIPETWDENDLCNTVDALLRDARLENERYSGYTDQHPSKKMAKKKLELIERFFALFCTKK